MKITITDDFDLEKIMKSGQAFRIKKMPDDKYRFVTGDKVLYVIPVPDSNNKYDVSCDENDWENVWIPYFNLDTSYKSIRKKAKSFKDDTFMQNACEYGKGIRILRQEPFEALISFIISQRKSIPSITSSIEKLCKALGTIIDETYDEPVYSFPTPEALAGTDLSTITNCSVGYRDVYIQNAARLVASEEFDLYHLYTSSLKDKSLSTLELIETLKSLHGVGTKVASCTALFGFHRLDTAPVDVWIQRIMDNYYEGNNPFDKYEEYAGVMQQYAFYYMIDNK